MSRTSVAVGSSYIITIDVRDYNDDKWLHLTQTMNVSDDGAPLLPR